MGLFLTWISLAIVLITFYTAFLWYRNRKKQSLFRVKLTILFLLSALKGLQHCIKIQGIAELHKFLA